jgi:hypothetical protein
MASRNIEEIVNQSRLRPITNVTIALKPHKNGRRIENWCKIEAGELM